MPKPLAHLLTGLTVCATLMVAAVFAQSPNLMLRLEGFNIFNHGNHLGRGVIVWVMTQRLRRRSDVHTHYCNRSGRACDSCIREHRSS